MKHGNPKNIEMSVELYREPGDGWDDNLLIINGGKHHHVFEKIPSDGEPHTISWTLIGNASGGEFCALDDAQNPGFVWLARQPDAKVFRQLRHQGKTLSLQNHHHDKSSEGIWHYQLFARFGDKVYGVPLTFSCGRGMEDPNPSIKNT
ncbi:hypothetical protein ACFFJT_01380 [Dyella flava]|uniref:Inclusion body protein n=1 Tax=Dyella flava TaxID=1920170 RepID=A0ABS2K1W5_9GAMM|nr:hypothetical protein [Dyella flava]MBM7125045.1 hypothetical protein [Dyella flava]GLQ52327.1 hypothetical protein GCM10010872_37760 [Dyella flava]